MRHRTVALLGIAVLSALALGPAAVARASRGDYGGAVGTLLAPFLVFVLVTLVVYVAARIVMPAGRVADWRATRLNHVGLLVTALALLGMATGGAAPG